MRVAHFIRQFDRWSCAITRSGVGHAVDDTQKYSQTQNMTQKGKKGKGKTEEGKNEKKASLQLSHPGVLDVSEVGATLADLTLARGGPTLATLVRPQSEDLGGGGGSSLRRTDVLL